MNGDVGGLHGGPQQQIVRVFLRITFRVEFSSNGMFEMKFPVWGRRGPGLTDQMIIDPWSIVHFISGTILWFIGFDFYQSIVILIIFEIWENSRFGIAFFNQLPNRLYALVPAGKRNKIEFIEAQKDYVGDSWGNLIFDIIFGLSGWLIASTYF